ncbi:MAG: hypothetical protein V1798_02410 [Pseudomonadota bacterium]
MKKNLMCSVVVLGVFASATFLSEVFAGGHSREDTTYAEQSVVKTNRYPVVETSPSSWASFDDFMKAVEDQLKQMDACHYSVHPNTRPGRNDIGSQVAVIGTVVFGIVAIVARGANAHVERLGLTAAGLCFFGGLFYEVWRGETFSTWELLFADHDNVPVEMYRITDVRRGEQFNRVRDLLLRYGISVSAVASR